MSQTTFTIAAHCERQGEITNQAISAASGALGLSILDNPDVVNRSETLNHYWRAQLSNDASAWYVIRTKQHKESAVRQRLSLFVEDVYLPLLKTRRPRQLVGQIEPLFPSYVFVRLRLGEQGYRLMHTPGVTALVSAGNEPCELDAAIVNNIRSRETNGVVVLDPKTLRPREEPKVAKDTVKRIDVLFQRYLSGAERIAVLMDSIGAESERYSARPAPW